MKRVKKEIFEHQQTFIKNVKILESGIIKASSLISKTFKKKGKIYIAGNGGSASDSQHFAAELIGRYKKKRKPFRAVSLAADIGTITCIANDYGYENIFARQLEALGNKNDLVIAISTSGNSRNILNLLKMSKKMKIYSIGFLGNQGGKSKKLCNYSIIIDSKDTARIQEMHQIIYHNICKQID